MMEMDTTYSANMQQDFAKKKLEREQEIQEIQEMLNNISKSPQKSLSKCADSTPKDVVEERKTDDIPPINTLRRSNTDLQVQVKSKAAAAPNSDNPRTSRRDSVRSANTAQQQQQMKPRSKSSQLPISSTTPTKRQVSKKTYNPEEARRFMENQKKKRKSEAANQPEVKANMEKEEIKRRLEELKKNTRKLVSKNLDKKKPHSNRNEMSKDAENISTKLASKAKEISKILEKSEKSKDEESGPPKVNNHAMKGISLQLQKPLKGCQTDRVKNVKHLKEDPPRSAHNVQAAPSLIPLGENHKRIGLLRKTEDEKDYSFSALKSFSIGKENVGLEGFAATLTTPMEENFSKEKVDKQKEMVPIVVQREPLPMACDKKENHKSSGSEEEISDLEIPSKNLRQSNTCKDNSSGHHVQHQEEHQQQHKANDLPYWLRPSAAQVYPYNFIMAVRRKLEAISQPATPVPNKREKTLRTTQCTSTTDLLKENATTDMLECEKKRKLLERPEEQERKKRKSLEMKDTEREEQTQESKKAPREGIKRTFTVSLESLKSPQTYNMDIQKDNSDSDKIDKSLKNRKSLQNSFEEDRAKSKFQSMESIASKYSSVSLPMPISNTLTEVSSLRTESRRTYTQSVERQSHLNTEDEVTSISSHIFSSPEKKYAAKPPNKDFEFVKPRPVSPLSLERIEKLKIKSKQTKSDNDMPTPPDTSQLADEDREMHFSQLLEDFNRSLSQVIQVNEQLKTTLDKSHRILSPRNPKRSPSSETTDKQCYSSDFENSPQQQQSVEKNKLKLSLENTNEKLKQRKRQLFEMASKVKPLLTPQKTSTESEQGNEDLKEAPLPKLDLDINLKLISNSSARTTTSTGTGTLEAEDSAGGEWENNMEMEGQATEEYEKRLSMIEQLKANLKQSILESQAKRQEKPTENGSYKVSSNSKANVIQSEEEFSNKTNRSNMSVYNLEQEDGIETLKKIKPKAAVREAGGLKIIKENLNKHEQKEEKKLNYNDCKDKEDLIQKYTSSLKEQNNKEETLVLYKRNKMMANENESESDERQNGADSKCSREKYTKMSNRTNQHDYKTSTSRPTSLKSKDSNTPSPQTHTLSELSAQKTSHTRSQATKEMQSDVASSATQSEMESLVATTHNSDKSKIARTRTTNAKASKEADNSSSIAEELQNTFETASQDNENQPTKLNSGNRSKLSTSSKHDNTAFIKSHINVSRGDFRDTKEVTLNETQFQLAIRSSRASSTEFGQSADDEVTSSSVKSIIKGQHSNYSNPPSYNAVASKKASSLTSLSPSKVSRRISIGTEIVNFFHQYENERSTRNNDTMSESSLNYSNVGMYDKLIQNELTKSQHLTALLKMREKALLDRTKGQIAWLEVQKARYKAKGLLGNIAAIKKKQRGILLKMEKEREEIKRLLQSTSGSSSNAKSSVSAATTTTTAKAVVSNVDHHHHHTSSKYRKDQKQPTSAPPVLASPVTRTTRPSKQAAANAASTKADQQPQSAPILRATYELESSQALEELLKKREDDLRKRREHVERLMKWHQRLDEEEAEVLQLERQLLNYNNVPQQLLVEQQQQQQQPQQQHIPQLHTVIADEEELTPAGSINDTTNTHQSTGRTPDKKRASRARKMEKRLKDIDKSLKELSHISASSAANSAIVMGQNSDDIDVVSSASTQQDLDFVRTTGSKLNKLWRRLTSQTIEKYEANRRYKLCKADLERLYEEAKMAVLRDFAQDEERTAQELLEKTPTNLSPLPQPPPPPSFISVPAEAAHNDGAKVNMLDIPVLNLNFSSGPSEAEEESANNTKMVAPPQGNYSPSVAEEHFKAHLLNSSASSSSESTEQQQSHISEGKKQQQRIENNVQMFLALTQRLRLPNKEQNHQGLQRSLSDTQIAEIPKFSAATSHRNISANASQSNTSITSNGSPSASAPHQQTTLPIHQRSKSSIAEITNIPNEKVTEKPSPPAQHVAQKSREEIAAEEEECSALDTLKAQHGCRASVITAVGRVSPIVQPQNTDDTAKDSSAAAAVKPRLSYSGQVGCDSDSKAREISSKLDEISAAVIQLSQANALPSYPAATAGATAINSKPASSSSSSPDSAVEQTSLNEESNVSTDASSYSLHFANISIDRHSSPGSQHATSIENRTKDVAAAATFTKEHSTASESESFESPHIGTFVVASPQNATTTSKTLIIHDSTASKTFVKEQTESELAKTMVCFSSADKHSSEEYEPDFELDSNDETHIEDISLALYETTTDTTNEEAADLNETPKADDEPLSDKTFCAEPPVPVKVTSKEQQQQLATARPPTITITSSPEKELLPPPPLPPPPPPPNAAATSSSSTSSGNGSNNNQLMPDIINELELRRHQLILDNEHLKQYEHVTAVPYMYVREIPNKPPPPYVPPAHGSPMTTIFPSEERIKDITFRRTHELYCELLKTEYCNEKGEKLPSVMEEQITNIYERIILDICREYLEEHNEIVRDGDPTNFHSQLAFFNPPNRLRCIQDAIYKEVRLCLAMDKTQPKRTQVYSVYGQRAKQDHIGKIIIQEMYDEDDRWCNFHREESEVIHLIIEEMISKNIRDTAREVLLEEGGSLDDEEDEEDDGIEIEEIEDTETQENLENARDEELASKASVLSANTNKKDHTPAQYINKTIDESSSLAEKEFVKLKSSVIVTSST